MKMGMQTPVEILVVEILISEHEHAHEILFPFSQLVILFFLSTPVSMTVVLYFTHFTEYHTYFLLFVYLGRI